MLRVFVLLLTLVLSAESANATIRYAGPLSNCGSGSLPACGNDNNDGLSESTPKTLKGWTSSASVNPGDTIIVLPGDYEDTAATARDVVFNPAVSGTAGSVITYRSQTPLGARIISTRDTISAWSVNGRSYIAIDGFYVHGTIFIMSSDNISVLDNEVTWGSWDGSSLIWGIVLQSSHSITVSDNYIHDLAPRTTQPAISDFSGGHNNMGICILGGIYNSTIEHNFVDGGGPLWRSYNGGLESGLWSVMWAGIGSKGGSMHDNTYRRNIITGTRYGFLGIGPTTVTSYTQRDHDQLLYENIVYDTQLGIIDADHSVWGWTVYNNTFVGCTGSTCRMFGAGSSDSADPSSSGGNIRNFTFYNNIYYGHRSVYRKEPSFLATYSANRATNLLAPWPTLTAGTSGSLATGTYWVRIAPVLPSTGETGTGVSMPVDVVGPNGSITVGWDATANSPLSYNVYVGTVDEAQTDYVNVAASGAAGSAQSVVYTGTGTSSKAYLKSSVNQWQWPAVLAMSDYNSFYGNTYIAVHGSGGSVYAASLANWITNTSSIGNGGVNHGAYDLHSISTDPLFVDAAQRNYRLQAGSPARLVGLGGVSMGAYPTDSGPTLGPRNGYWSGTPAGTKNFDMWMLGR